MIEQIEQWRKENEEEYYGLDRDSVRTALSKFEDALERISELQKALEWYANEENHIVQYGSFDAMLPPKVMEDDGERARQALRGSEPK